MSIHKVMGKLNIQLVEWHCNRKDFWLQYSRRRSIGFVVPFVMKFLNRQDVLKMLDETRGPNSGFLWAKGYTIWEVRSHFVEQKKWLHGLKHLLLLQRTKDQFQRLCQVAHSFYNSNSRESDDLVWPRWAEVSSWILMVYKYTKKYAPAHKTVNNLKSLCASVCVCVCMYIVCVLHIISVFI